MGMNIGNSESDDDVMVDINTTPLIDVMLVLLIMLIITIPIQLHSVNLNMPVGNPPPATQPPPVLRIDVLANGTVLWAGTPLANRDELEVKLREVAAQPDQPEVHLRPDRAVEYNAVAQVMTSAQRIGVTKIGLVGNEQFLNQ